MILAGDIGGTKTLIGLFDPSTLRPMPVDVREFATTAYPGLPAILDEFFASQAKRSPLTAAVFGVAGPIINKSAEMTNVDWHVNGDELIHTLGIPDVRLLNDLEAMAYGVPMLKADELSQLQAGKPQPDGNIGLIAAGTGLGAAILHYVEGRYVPVPSEGGHTDFAARTDRELELVPFLRARYGRAELEHVLSGPGLVTLSEFTHQDGDHAVTHLAGDQPDIPAEVTRSALSGECLRCVEALDLFVEAYGAAAGNLALTAVTRTGIFLGGGIAPRILPALHSGRFIQAFNDKGPMRPLLEAIPVQVILNAKAGLLGAAAYANQMLAGR